jgi:hypothetical protein
MIDEKKIEEAKQEIYEDRFLLNGEEVVFDNDAKEEMFYKEDIKEAIRLGAKWAINEFLKGLWHPISDKPEEHTDIIYIDEDKDFWDINNYDSNNFDDSFGKGWESACRTQDIYKWAYKDDLFPKKGGEQ